MNPHSSTTSNEYSPSRATQLCYITGRSLPLPAYMYRVLPAALCPVAVLRGGIVFGNQVGTPMTDSCLNTTTLYIAGRAFSSSMVII